MATIDSTIFPAADQLRSDSRTWLVCHNEIRGIENSILFASENSLLDVIVYNTYQTDTNIPPFVAATSVNNTLNQIVKNGHGLLPVDEIEFTTTGVLPVPLIAGQSYYTIGVDYNNFKVANGFLDAVNNVPIDLVDSGTGTLSFRKITPAQKYYRVWQGLRNDRARGNEMNGVIKYFTDLGYQIKRKTNPVTNSTYEWHLSW